MKKLYLVLFSLIFITSCSNNNIFVSSIDDNNSISVKHNYSEISEYKIKWKDVFFIAKPQYFVYFYSLSCSHCNELKNSIIEYSLNNKNIYFCENSKDVIISENTSNTIGIGDISKLSILGFPSLVKIENTKLIDNIAGIDKIKSELKI